MLVEKVSSTRDCEAEALRRSWIRLSDDRDWVVRTELNFVEATDASLERTLADDWAFWMLSIDTKGSWGDVLIIFDDLCLLLLGSLPELILDPNRCALWFKEQTEYSDGIEHVTEVFSMLSRLKLRAIFLGGMEPDDLSLAAKQLVDW